jgi:MFS family permease
VSAPLPTRLAPLADGRFRLLFLATFGSGIGNWLAVIALQIDVFDRTGSGWWVGGLLVANILPAVFLGLLFGPLVDRLSRRGLMITSDLIRLAAFAALPFVSSAAAIVALAAVAGVGNAFFRPAVLAGLPNLVGEAQLAGANALLQIVEWTTTAAGPLAGGAIVAASGPELAYWINAATFAFSAALVALIPARLLQSDRPVGRGHWADLADGFRVVRRSRALMSVLVVWTIVMFAAGVVNLAEVFLAKRSYDSGDFGFGVLWAATGVGLIAGGLAAARLIERFGLGGAYTRLLVVYALGIAGAAAAPGLALGAGATAVYGFGNGGALVANITLVQTGAPDRLRGRAFTVLMSVTYASLGTAFVAGGPITDALGARWAYAGAAVLVALAAAVAAQMTRGVDLARLRIAEAA